MKLAFVFGVILVSSLTNLGCADWLTDLDPTNKNSKVREGLREMDPTSEDSAVSRAGRAIDPTIPSNRRQVVQVVYDIGDRIDPTNANNWGHWTNRFDVEADLKRGGWEVAFGEELSHGEYVKIGIATAASIAAENPGPLIAYLKDFSYRCMARLLSEIGLGLRSQLKEYIEKALADALNGQTPAVLQIDGLQVEVGIATYHRAERVASHKVSTPNTHQPYVRWRFTQSGSNSHVGSGTPAGQRNSGSNTTNFLEQLTSFPEFNLNDKRPMKDRGRWTRWNATGALSLQNHTDQQVHVMVFKSYDGQVYVNQIVGPRGYVWLHKPGQPGIGNDWAVSINRSPMVPVCYMADWHSDSPAFCLNFHGSAEEMYARVRPRWR